MPAVDPAQALRDLLELFREARRTSHDPDALDEAGARALLREMRGAEDPEDVDGVLDRANELIGGHGVEAIHDEDAWVNNYYGDITFLYVNMGDPYIRTIGYDTKEEEFVVAGWGDWAEQKDRQRELERDEGYDESWMYDDDSDESRRRRGVTVPKEDDDDNR